MKTEEWQEKAAFIAKLRELTERLNRCRAAYEAHTPLVSDEVYDILFSDLQTLEMSAAMNVRFAKKSLSVCRASELPDPASSAGFALPAMRR